MNKRHFCYVTNKVVLLPQREDSDKIGQLVYFPPNGTFNLMYYPYYGKKAQVRLNCQAWSDSLLYKYQIENISSCG